LISNDYYPALARDNVAVVTEGIERIEAHAIVTRGGVRHAVDAIVYGTGFRAQAGLAPVRIVGTGGRTLDDVWRDGMSAYLGTSVAGFPNLFLLIGPNTGLGHNSMVYMIESQINYVLDALRALGRRRARAGRAAGGTSGVQYEPRAQAQEHRLADRLYELVPRS